MSDVPVLWRPPADGGDSRMARFARALGHDPADYDTLWRWSVTDLDAFWAAVWQQLGVRAHTPYQDVLCGRELPGARWFPGATLNYAEHALSRCRSQCGVTAPEPGYDSPTSTHIPACGGTATGLP